VRQAVEEQGMDTRIAGQHFPEGTRRRIAVENRPNILAHQPEHEAASPFQKDGNFKKLD
jgi:hypothetical protein